MKVDKDELLAYCYSEKQAGKSYLEIRKSLEERGIEKEIISVIIREVDEMVLAQVDSSKYTGFNTVRIMGYILLFGGGLLTIGTYTSIIDLNGRYMITYGPVIGGYSLIVASRISKRKKGISRKSYFRKK